ncbi:enoyl-CoA hydratase-related protein [Amycolatopsis saalfeldensis]|uniref:Enoyl-CoA hydratase/carnithine racemase n=1 Tax=Amycolatopsis saalfeldensis TaxID=394193 RepID=A0A1H8YM18_9PSEU|nr:enoyl-CoA hydratase-related protein [Amycolatopsis saalfeldensis]SEP53041.1 Enoyl-CoA hydratase/carnithine racemase [Amycolatopsis saalfeldensis]
MPELSRTEAVFVLNLGEDENRFSPDWLEKANSLIDTVVAGSEPAALVTVGGGKFYSNGLDLDWLLSHGDEAGQYVTAVQELLARVLELPVPTVAAVNGHAFGAGAMLAMAHDFRVMRTDRGYFCFPEADINIPFTPGMAALLQGKLTPSAAIASMTTGRRFGGPQARELGLVDATADEATLVEAAATVVRDLAGKDRGTLGAIKATMFAPALTALRTPAA